MEKHFKIGFNCPKKVLMMMLTVICDPIALISLESLKRQFVVMTPNQNYLTTYWDVIGGQKCFHSKAKTRLFYKTKMR